MVIIVLFIQQSAFSMFSTSSFCNLANSIIKLLILHANSHYYTTLYNKSQICQWRITAYVYICTLLSVLTISIVTKNSSE